MRNYLLLICAFVLLFFSCTENDPPNGNGVIVIDSIVFTYPEEQPDFTLTVKNETTSEIAATGLVSEFADKKIDNIPAGNYTVTISSYADGFTAPAFDGPWYMAEVANVKVTAGKETNITMECVQGNVGVSFVYDDSLANVGMGNIIPKLTQNSSPLTYSGDKKNAVGYFLPGAVTLSFKNGDNDVLANKNAVVQLDLKIGQKLEIIVSSVNVAIPDPENQVLVIVEEVVVAEESNSYILKPGGNVIIPVSRAYDVWEQVFATNLEGRLDYKVLWIDTPDGLSADGTIEEIMLLDGDKGSDAGIFVMAGSKPGNALIAATVADEIVWSWHIWVTEYDPEQPSGQVVYNNNTLMDRNLGALNTIRGDVNSLGNYYQWGRKDPFPSPAETQIGMLDTTLPREIYDENGTPLTMGRIDEEGQVEKFGTGITYAPPPYYPEMPNIEYSIKHPNYFIYSLTAKLIPPFSNSWTSNHLIHSNDMMTDLWNNSDDSKTIYDPCPVGWRVPNDVEIFTTGTQGQNEANKFTVGEGLDFGAGYFPAAGNTIDHSGEYHNVGHVVLVWTGKVAGYGGLSMMCVYNGEMYIPGGDPTNKYEGKSTFRVLAASVRCVKE